MTIEEQLNRIIELAYEQVELAKEVGWRYLEVRVQEAHKRVEQHFDWMKR
jgi:L-ribulose-5-phosphate 3-epimerase UlaE